MKKIQFILFILATALFAGSASAAIINYKVPASVKLDEILTVDGQIDPAVDNVRCSMRIYDSNGAFIKRLTDEYTTGGGVFSSSYLKITEPVFMRLDDYNVVSDCDGNIAFDTFNVGQARGPDYLFLGTAFYLKDNMELIVLCLFIVFILVVLIAYGWWAIKQ